jgi:deazaflavin-dependent oxidoreductase (nitroreductase family)
MTTDANMPATARAPAFVSILNPVIRRLLGAGLPVGPNVLLTVPGRTTGVPRTVPVAVIEVADRRFVQSPFGEVNWVRNLRAAGEAIVTKGRDRQAVDAIELEPDAAAGVLQDALGPYLRSRLLAPLVRQLFHLEPNSTPEAYAAEARLHPMFELRGKKVDPSA